MQIDREKFFAGYRRRFNSLSQQQVNGLNFILDSAEKDRFLLHIEWLAYMLATTKLETAHTFQPVHEYGGRNYFIRRYGSQTRVGRGLGNDTPEEGAYYAGRGDVQLTGESNYERAEEALRKQYPELIADFEQRTGKVFDLTVGDQPNDLNDPNNAQDPAIAYAIMSFGMRTGMFTGRKLSDYIGEGRTDYRTARKIINGMSGADIIAGYAREFEAILKESVTQVYDWSVPTDQPRVLKLGMEGEDVMRLQHELVVYAFLSPEGVTGMFDEATDEGVRGFQMANGLKVDGKVGPNTGRVLFGE